MGVEENFFDLGGHSLLLVRATTAVNEELGCELTVVDLFSHPSVKALARHLADTGVAAVPGGAPAAPAPAEAGAPRPAWTAPVSRRSASGPPGPAAPPRTRGPRTMDETAQTAYEGEPAIAVIGMAARFPGADTVEEFWENLAAYRESIRPVTDEEFLAAGGDPADLDDPAVVRMASVIEGIDRFDSAFFGYSPAEAELIDPQQRLLLESAYHAMEDAGYGAGHGEAQVGVYAGAGDSRYYPANVHPRFAGQGSSVALVHAATSNSLGTLATRISYELGLTGPSLSLQTACSTALVAIDTACQDLIDYKCDVALAGAASLNPGAMLGYRYIPDGPFSPTAAAGPSPRTPRAPPPATGWASWSSSGWRTPSPTATGSGP
ncbi:beta-ketoacyl synthase N-terminal-like domain-containing protein [Streptomyces stramineus]